jgi:hypothetical protein
MLTANELMPLDEFQRGRVLDWLDTRCPHFRCPACGQREWAVCGLAEPGGVLPQVCVGCHQCGYVAHFCAVMLGLAPREEERE